MPVTCDGRAYESVVMPAQNHDEIRVVRAVGEEIIHLFFSVVPSEAVVQLPDNQGTGQVPYRGTVPRSYTALHWPQMIDQ